MLLALVAGCFATTSRPICVEDPTDVADDEVTALGTPAEVVERASGERQEPATLEDGSLVTATVAAARGDGSARYVASQAGLETSDPTWGFGHSTLTIGVFCEDHLDVPAVGTLATDDGSFDVALDGTLSTLVFGASTDGVGFDAIAPFSESGFPDPDEPELGTYHDQHAFLQITFADDGTTAGQAGWEGQRETASTSEDRAHYQVKWPPRE